MDDASRLEGDTHLNTSQKGNKGLPVLQAIINDGSCDVSTQTISTSVMNPADNQQNQGVNLKEIFHRNNSRAKKSSFRLFIVPDDHNSGNDSGVRLSLDQEQPAINSQSLCFSVISSECFEKNKSTKPLHDSKQTETIQSRNTFKRSERSRKGTASTVSLENGNNDTMTDHQLVHSTNPSVLAWLKVKNFEEREKRRRKKQEKKELRRHAHEEAERRQKRIEENEKQFAQWLIAKKKEARRAWRETRAKKRVGTVENESTVRKDSDPPPNYTAVPTFNGAQVWANNTNSRSTDDSELETSNVLKHQYDITTEPSRLFSAQLKTQEQQSTNGTILENNQESNQVRLRKDNDGKNNKRPATADSSKLSSRKTKDIWPEQESKGKRPSTSGGRLTCNTNTMVDKQISYEAWMVQKRKEQKSKRRTTTNASDPSHKDGKKLGVKNPITFEAWNAKKRQEIRENAKLKKREIVDDALTEAILKMGRKRVENSYKEKRHLDTGMPKWQARNRVNSSTEEKNASISKTSHNTYAVIIGNEIDNHNTREKGTHAAKEISMVRTSCENLKLD
jgi:hypothetical protein